MRKLCFAALLLLCANAPALAIEWHALFLAGDDSIENFDNGRRDLSALLDEIGDIEAIQVTSSRRVARREDIVFADEDGVEQAFGGLQASKGQGCLIHLTSHGNEDGLYLAHAATLDPDHFARLVDRACGKYPTVILVSACYSGVFITDQLEGPNRIILTAARDDRPSFGCSSDTRYTYWDACLLENIEAGALWRDVYDRVRSCVRREEREIGADASEPQAFFGAKAGDWAVVF
ncbi:C13 family peptidase [Devosia sp. SL43]|uniref:C13 family peptidase n=1 Tax=Devosia sp. SL43 TaxID=2806348 RepID=UPI001F2B358B|nr:C13 family peptidase [Devosia sp. SL43]UJW86054.1 hypothetical protein IM737_01845 [Devosia sp. SL43]